MNTPPRLRLIKTTRNLKRAPAQESDAKKPPKLWAEIAGQGGSLQYRPLVVIPELAKVIGLNHAIVLGQLDYWLQKAEYKTDDGTEDGCRWIYNTLAEWQCCFPWWDLSTIKRIFRDLRDQKLVIVDQFDRSRLRRENWYSIDYGQVKKTLRTRIAAVASEVQQQRETIKTRRRFRGGNQPLLSDIQPPLSDILKHGWGSI